MSGQLIARTAPRESVAIEGLEWWVEYRLVRVEAGPYAGHWDLERRYTANRPGERGVDEGWKSIGRAPTRIEAARCGIGDSNYDRAESLDPVHRVAADAIRMRRIRASWVQRVRAIAEGSRLNPILAEGRAEFDAALKRARIYRKAQKGEADPAQIEALRAPLLEKYGARVERERRIVGAAKRALELHGVRS
jgi:hypothetical protein